MYRGIVFANINAGRNKGTTPALCAIFAKSSGNWRNFIRKAFIPENLVGDSSDKTKAAALENARLGHIRTAVPGVTPASVVKFALFDRKKKSGQMVLPQTIGSQFFAKCFKVEGGDVAQSDKAASEVGTASFPTFAYNGATLRDDWHIAPEAPASQPEDAEGCA
ncbi:hypothetical protein GSI_04908 [Ganoderma sinense ZZ0214-1]|uniref:Uncharacterized protein n=1 Tax=Ganoderma sinense ZZ0214-1 TaxID=1077348 RepID=A0A2G8SGB2_9APHY|nr:hypothetical protein GSI_04908 [Ganoderma sinense ZZ0214-1]